MGTTFVISDTHFGHYNIINYCRQEMGWLSYEEMDEALVQRWNEVVKPKDKVYHLGDVTIARRHLPTIGRCNGSKCLIKGNHDLWKLRDYAPFFYDIRAYRVLPACGIVLSHIPIHPMEVSGRFCGNAHGHLHKHVVRLGDKPDPRYLNVCVEHTGYRPIPLDQIIEHFRKINEQHQ